MQETTKSLSAKRELPLQESNRENINNLCWGFLFTNKQTKRYLDPVGRDAVSFDHITRKITGHSDAGDHFSGKYEDFRSAAQRECEAYVADHYATGTGAVYNGTEVRVWGFWT